MKPLRNPLCRPRMQNVTEFKKRQSAYKKFCRSLSLRQAGKVLGKMPLSLDAREVLMHLNEMGYRRITAEQLKEFLQDLRKLIKYEERLGVLKQPTENSVDKRFEMLHKASTASYRAKTKTSKPDENRCPKLKDSGKVTPKKSTPKKAVKKIEKAAPSSSREKKMEKIKTPTSAVESKLNKMWIRPKSAQSCSTTGKTCDPVQLYQFYNEEWKKFRNNLPGENDHTELRWNIRQRLLGA